MFLTTDIMLVTKSDLLPYVPFSVDAVIKDAHEVNSEIGILVLSALKGDGVDEWCNWLFQKVHEKKEANIAVSIE
jgi:hydrogenase nickel incorporation protein HypB